MMGWIPSGEVRLPLCEMKSETKAVLRRTLQALKLVR
jgi:hypothetical protein